MKQLITILIGILFSIYTYAGTTCEVCPKFNYGTENMSGTFKARANTDISTVLWSFSDGTTASGLEVKHTFEEAGKYAFTLSITDVKGRTETRHGKIYIFDLKGRKNDHNNTQNHIADTKETTTQSLLLNTREEQESKAVTTINNIGTVANYPNPFSTTTTLSFEVEKEGVVAVNVYDLGGKLVRSLHNSTMLPGQQEIRFERENLTKGIYVVRIEAAQQHTYHKVSIQ